MLLLLLLLLLSLLLLLLPLLPGYGWSSAAAERGMGVTAIAGIMDRCAAQLRNKASMLCFLPCK
jgi:hypothetical protein